MYTGRRTLSLSLSLSLSLRLVCVDIIDEIKMVLTPRS